ncbi:MAG: hypothetical protein ACE5H7_05375 [Acidiferrobacterales bacterium]
MKIIVASVIMLFLGGCASGPSTTDGTTYVFCGLQPEGLSRVAHYCMDGPNR